MLRKVFAPLAALVLIACSSSKSPAVTGDSGSPALDSGGPSADGSTDDAGIPDSGGAADDAGGSIPFMVVEQLFFGSTALGGYELKLVDYAGACPLEAANDTHKENSEYIEFVFAGASSIPAGTYTVGTNVTIAVHQRDASCNLSASDNATAGSLTVTSSTSTALVGTFTATIAPFGTVSGSINAAFCDLTTQAPDGGLADSGIAGCVP